MTGQLAKRPQRYALPRANQAENSASIRMRMQKVQARYDAHLAATYAGPRRYAERRFWARRGMPDKPIDEPRNIFAASR